MKFEHLLEVNDPSGPAAAPLNREELWFGLLCRAEDARPFLPGLEACRITARDENSMERELDFGGAVIRDRVSFRVMEWICFESAATAAHAGGRLVISIEEPQQGALFLCFQYSTTLPDDAADEEGRYASFIRAAYLQSDIDTLKVIRALAQSRRIH